LIQRFSKRIINWYEKHKRNLPWRNTKDAYVVWVSEIILQQTRVEQGLHYFNRFINKFPSITVLADASIDDVLKLWQGLGYYSRARNMHEAAVFIKQHFNSVFPKEYADIIALKGIGKYTASAIASFAFDNAYPVVDGNVMRMVSRLFGIYTPVDSTEGKNKIYKIVSKLIDKSNPSSFNQAIMEFGALQCTPSKPKCSSCVFNKDCYSFCNNCVNKLPVKGLKIKHKECFFNYFVIEYKHKNSTFVYIKRRINDDIWKGLYDYPLIETKEIYTYSRLISGKDWKKIIGDNAFDLKEISKVYKHNLTHQKIISQFISISISEKLVPVKSNPYTLIKKKEMEKYAIPKLIDRYLADTMKNRKNYN